MKIAYIFYLVGVIFILASVIYFSREFISQFSNSIKATLLVTSIILTFVLAEVLRRRDK